MSEEVNLFSTEEKKLFQYASLMRRYLKDYSHLLQRNQPLFELQGDADRDWIEEGYESTVRRAVINVRQLLDEVEDQYNSMEKQISDFKLKRRSVVELLLINSEHNDINGFYLTILITLSGIHIRLREAEHQMRQRILDIEAKTGYDQLKKDMCNLRSRLQIVLEDHLSQRAVQNILRPKEKENDTMYEPLNSPTHPLDRNATVYNWLPSNIQTNLKQLWEEPTTPNTTPPDNTVYEENSPLGFNIPTAFFIQVSTDPDETNCQPNPSTRRLKAFESIFPISKTDNSSNSFTHELSLTGIRPQMTIIPMSPLHSLIPDGFEKNDPNNNCIPHFDGSQHKFSRFWSYFYFSVHAHTKLDVSHKICLLNALLIDKGPKHRNFQGLKFHVDDYDEWIRRLVYTYGDYKERYGYLCDRIRAIPSNKCEDSSECLRTYQACHIILEEHRVYDPSLMSITTTPLIERVCEKFPAYIIEQFPFIRSYDNTNFVYSLDDTMKLIRKRIELMAEKEELKGQTYHKKNCCLFNKWGPPTTRNSLYSLQTPTVICWKCFSSDHESNKCPKENCSLCQGMHDKSLCTIKK